MIDPRYKQDMTKLVRIISRKPEIIPTLLNVAENLDDVNYGEINIKVQGGKPIWVDVIKRERVG